MSLPTSIHPFLITGNDANQFKVANSLRFRSSASAYLNRTPGTPTDNTKWTFSVWTKKTQIGGSYVFQGATAGAGAYCMSLFSGDQLYIMQYAAAAFQLQISTNALYRDPSQWYHVMFVWDTGQATSTITGSPTDRVRIYVNGSQVTSFSYNTAPSQNASFYWGNPLYTAVIGYRNYNNDAYYDGYMAEMNFIDGQALSPSYFAQNDPTTGQWVPKKYTGTYGTNGFYLPFNDATSTTTLGYDRQLNMSDSSKNNWTLNNISVTSGTTYDSMRDSPTGYDDGGNGRGNYCVANPLALGSVSAPINGNLTQTLSGLNGTGASGTFVVTSGKWYWEVVSNATTNAAQYVGLIRGALSSTAGPTTNPSGFYYGSSGNNREDGTTVTYGNTWLNLGVDYIIGVALDCDSNTVVFYVNNVSQGTRTLPSTTSGWKPQLGFNSSSGSALMNYNFGQRPFAYTPPAGFKALNSFNLPNPSLPLV